MPPTTNTRYPEIDFLKGLACVLMMIGHAIRIRTPVPGTPEKFILYLMDYSGPIFFFISGMNVMTFLERNKDKPGFKATGFYLASTALLFIFSIVYNVNRANLYTMEIFQGVAVCTAAVYLLMRSRLPAWAHWVIIAALYAFYLQFRIRLELGIISPNFQALRAAIPAGAGISDRAMIATIVDLGKHLHTAQRILFLHFGPLPWIVFFYIGALCYRSVTRHGALKGPWVIFFSLLFILGQFAGRSLFAPGKSFIDSIFLANYVELDLRGVPGYVMSTIGGAGLLYLLFRRLYPGAQAITNSFARWPADRIEALGKESLLFLVAHWWVISTIIIFDGIITKKPPGTPATIHEVAIRVFLSLAVLIFIVPWLARVRDRWRLKRNFAPAMGAVLLGSLLFATLMVKINSAAWANYVTYPASFAFAFLFPFLRERLRARFTNVSVEK